MGLPRKRNYAGRWDVLIDQSTKCLNKLLEVGASKKRNYILDQVFMGGIVMNLTGGCRMVHVLFGIFKQVFLKRYCNFN